VDLDFDRTETLTPDEHLTNVVAALVRLRQLRGGADTTLDDLAARVAPDPEVDPAVTAGSIATAAEQPRQKV
jgi:hypothetical protein